MRGYVTDFIDRKPGLDKYGYGFIREEGAPPDQRGTVFFHHSDVIFNGYVGKEQIEHVEVEFEFFTTQEGSVIRHKARKVRIATNAR